MTDVHRVNRTPGAFGTGVSSVSAGAGGNGSGSFRDSLGGQLKDDYRRRVESILDALAALSSEFPARVDIRTFHQYLGQMRALLSEIIRNAYALSTESILDAGGRRRFLSAVDVVDQKLSDLAQDILSSNGDNLDYICRVDEIRGLIMDILL